MTARTATISAAAVDKKETVATDIPDYLIYETIDGRPIYYRGYREVLNNTKKLQDIMGYGELQLYLLSYLSEYFIKKLGDKFRILPGESGLHLKKNNNLSLDLTIMDKDAVKLKDLKNKYSQRPPRIVIEVDTKADGEINRKYNYFNKKTIKLLEFGVEKVVWIFTETEQVMVAENNKPWLTVNWTDEIEVLGHSFTIQQVIEEAEKKD